MTHTFPAWLRQSVWVVLLLVAAAAFHYNRTAIRLTPAAGSPLVGALTVRDVAGRAHSLGDLRGKVVVVSLWASWCGPCRREVPRLSRLYDELGSAGLTVWAINAESLEGADLARVAAELGMDYAALSMVGDLDAVLSGGDVLPFTWLIDREGRLRAAHGGLPSEASLRRASRRLLAEGRRAER